MVNAELVGTEQFRRAHNALQVALEHGRDLTGVEVEQIVGAITDAA